MEQYTVYVRTDEAGRIVAVNSSAFVADPAGWTAVGAGTGDRYFHAQGHYLEKPLYDADGCANYKLENGAPALRTQQEKAAELAARSPSAPTQLDRVEAQAVYTAMMTDTLLES